MTGIFDSIIDSISGMDDWNWMKAGGAAIKTITSAGKKDTDVSMKELERGLLNIAPNNNMQASKSEAVKAPSAEDIESNWYARLNKFGSMQGTTSVKPR